MQGIAKSRTCRILSQNIKILFLERETKAIPGSGVQAMILKNFIFGIIIVVGKIMVFLS